MSRRASKDIPTLPLFDEPPRVVRERQKPPRSSAWAYCPKCKRSTKTGLVRQGQHLYWRGHFITTWAFPRRPCMASFAPLHAVAPRVSVENPPACPCGGAE